MLSSYTSVEGEGKALQGLSLCAYSLPWSLLISLSVWKCHHIKCLSYPVSRAQQTRHLLPHWTLKSESSPHSLHNFVHFPHPVTTLLNIFQSIKEASYTIGKFTKTPEQWKHIDVWKMSNLGADSRAIDTVPSLWIIQLNWWDEIKLFNLHYHILAQLVLTSNTTLQQEKTFGF